LMTCMGLWLGMLFKVSFRKLKKKKTDWNRYCIIPCSSAITFLPVMNRIAPWADSTLYLIVNRKREFQAISQSVLVSNYALCYLFAFKDKKINAKRIYKRVWWRLYLWRVSFSFATLQACSKDGRSTIQIIDLIIMVVVLF
jgi:hypothetical protein